MKFLRQFTLLMPLTLIFSLARAQTSTTSLRGTVTDPSGSVVAEATVVLTNAECRTERTATTGAQGGYQFLAVSPGTYTLDVTAKGFRIYAQTDLELPVNTPRTPNRQLQGGQLVG